MRMMVPSLHCQRQALIFCCLWQLASIKGVLPNHWCKESCCGGPMPAERSFSMSTMWFASVSVSIVTSLSVDVLAILVTGIAAGGESTTSCCSRTYQLCR